MISLDTFSREKNCERSLQFSILILEGMEIPISGLGTYLADDPAKLKAALHYAIEECGYRHIDCAAFYKNQTIIGEALKEIFDAGKVKREEVFITSKVWNTKHREDLLIKDAQKTVKELQLDYIDLFLVHWPTAFEQREDDEYEPRDENGKMKLGKVDIIDTWKAMEKVYDMGLAKHIGVSNFSIEQLERLRYADVKYQPYCNQVEAHLYQQQPVLLNYLESRKMYMTCYTCLGRARLTGPYGVPLLQDPVLEKIAKEHGKTTAQTNLKFLKQLSPYLVVIPMSLNPTNIKANFDLDFTLTDAEMEELKARNRNFRFVDPYNGWGYDALCLGHQ